MKESLKSKFMFNDLEEVIKAYHDKVSKIILENVEFNYTKDDGEKKSAEQVLINLKA